MAEIKNSELLEKLFAYAKNLGNGRKATVTAERYIVSVIDILSGVSGIELTDDEKNALTELLVARFPFAEAGFADVKAHMLKRVDEVGDNTYMDSIYMQQRVYKAKETANKRQLDRLTAEILLSCILDDPNEYIKGYMKKEEKTGEETDATTSDVEKELLDKILGGMSRKEPEEEPRTETITTEKNPKSAVFELVERVKVMREKLSAEVLGQENAIGVFASGYFQSEISALTDKNRTKPRATFLFAGPPGVGKTMLAKKAAVFLGLPFCQFDMSEYCDKEAALEFIGSDAVYKGSKSGNFTDYVSKNPKCVILFDEIEKAHISIIHLFLQILDQGRIRDSKTDAELSLSNVIMIFTTNAGKQLYEGASSNDLSGITRKVILKALEQDVNPETKQPYFPAAICSRFASGNVVMFNYMAANDLHTIARKEMLRHAENFEKTFGVKIRIDEKVYSALLFSEGGTADARTITSRAESFFNTEIFELFRLLDSDKTNHNIEDLETVSISVDLPDNNEDITSLFVNTDKENVLVVSSDGVAEKCRESCRGVEFLRVGTVEETRKCLNNADIGFALLDLSHGRTKDKKYLNAEDADSVGRDIFWHIREHYPDLPVYLLQANGRNFNSEERLSFSRQGVRGFVSLSRAKNGFSKDILQIGETVHQQRSIERLAKANKIVSFETAQIVSSNGKDAQIRLFDFEYSVAVDAEDSKNVLSNVSKPDVRFDQVIGAEDAKKELQYFVSYLKNPKKYMGTGVSAPKGVLLYGPPGTGKTMLAKAMASESDVTFITAEGNQFLKKYVGEGSDKVHELFRTARKYAPAILFVDEIDAIAKERRGGDQSEGTEATLTAFLTEMDGFKNDTTKPVFVLAATNFDVEPGGEKSLDPALLRRFDRRVYIDLPTRDERLKYIRMKFAEREAFELSEEKIKNIAVRSTGMSLADLESVIELSLRTAIRDGNLKVTDAIFDEAFEIFNGGEAKKWDSSQLERVARHEAGHAFLCWQSGETPSYVTIVARGDHGGYMQHDDNEGKAIYTKDELLSRIRTSLGGRAAEMVYYGEKDGVTTGASGDLVSATNMARHLICAYGMDEKFGLAVIDQQAARAGELSLDVREAVNAILSEEMQKAVKAVEENKAAIDALVEKLLSENHLTGDVIRSIFENRTK